MQWIAVLSLLIGSDIKKAQESARKAHTRHKFPVILSRGVHNMLRVRVCAAHMGGFLGPKFSRQGSVFRQIFLKRGWVIQKLAKNSKNGWFSAKIHHKVGMTASFGN